MNRYGAIRTAEEKEQKAKGWNDVAFHLVSNLRKSDDPKHYRNLKSTKHFSAALPKWCDGFSIPDHAGRWLTLKRLRYRAGSLALVEKSRHGACYILGLLHHELMPGFANDQVIGISEGSLHSFSGCRVFCISLPTE